MSRYHQGKYSPKNPSKYMGDPTKIFYRSSWEKKCMIKFDTSPQYLKWSSEETVVPYISPLDGRPHRYFIDFKVIVINRLGEYKTFIIEVKPYKETIPPTRNGKSKQRLIKEVSTFAVNTAKWTYARAYCKKMGYDFIIMTEHDINPKPLGKKK